MRRPRSWDAMGRPMPRGGPCGRVGRPRCNGRNTGLRRLPSRVGRRRDPDQATRRGARLPLVRPPQPIEGAVARGVKMARTIIVAAPVSDSLLGMLRAAAGRPGRRRPSLGRPSVERSDRRCDWNSREQHSSDICRDTVVSSAPEGVSTVSVGVDHIDVNEATARKVVVCNTPGVLDGAVPSSPCCSFCRWPAERLTTGARSKPASGHAVSSCHPSQRFAGQGARCARYGPDRAGRRSARIRRLRYARSMYHSEAAPCRVRPQRSNGVRGSFRDLFTRGSSLNV